MKEKIVKSVLNKKKKRDDWFLDDYTLNPYEGCSFNCQYCYVRGSKYGENMEETLSVKINSPEVLDKQLASRAKKNQYGIIALASATDPYLRIEERYGLTRQFLEIILKHRFPVLMITKSPMILRDTDLLTEIDRVAIHAPDLTYKMKRGVTISFSFSTLDSEIAATLEPGAPLPSERLRALQECKKRGLKAGVHLMPVLPFINDSPDQLDRMIQTFSDAGADYVLVGGLTLFGNRPSDSRTLYYQFLERKFPSLISDYKKLYRIFFSPPPAYNNMLASTVASICEKYKIKNTITDS